MNQAQYHVRNISVLYIVWLLTYSCISIVKTMNIKKTLGCHSCNNKIFSLKCLVGKKKAKRILVFSFSLFQTNKALISTVSIFFIFFVANLNWNTMLDLAQCHSLYAVSYMCACILACFMWLARWLKRLVEFSTLSMWLCLANKESGSCLD